MAQHLFYSTDIGQYLSAKLEDLKRRLNATAAADTERESLPPELEQVGHVSPIILDLDGLKTDLQEATVAVRHFAYEGEHTVEGVRITVRVPFTGDSGLLHCKPSTWSTTLVDGKIDGRTISAFLDRPGIPSSDEIKLWRTQWLGNLEKWVGFVNADVEGYNQRLPALVAQAVGQRRQQLGNLDQLRRDLNG